MIPKAEDTTFDPSRRFVRFLRVNPQGFVEFAFAIGAPELSVELMLRPEDFEEFCNTHRVERLDVPAP
jgi:phenol hydroxylase P0 protein